MTAPEPLVDFQDVTFGYQPDTPPVVANVTFAIHPGEVVTLLGASGCGKSTLMNMVAGLVRPQSGQCLFDGHPITGINTEVGYMTQEDTLLPWRTVRANVALALKLRGVRKRDIGDRVESHLAMLDLTPAARRYPAQLSGGMKRRALLARSVITEPRMVLMDEPFAAIDADLREELHQEMRRTVVELDQTVLFVTHDIGEAALLSDRVVVFAGAPTSHIAGIVTIPFGRRRDLERLRVSDEYFDAQKTLRELLREGHAARRSDAGDGAAARADGSSGG